MIIYKLDKKTGKKIRVVVPDWDYPLPITQPAYDVGVFSSDSFTPVLLFSSGQKGVWYDVSDMSTLFQDSAGTTPVTAVGQTVGKILDKSGNNAHATQSVLANRPTYQRDADGNGYLQFNGTSTTLATTNIDFSSTDKMMASIGLFVDNPSTGSAGVAVVLGSNPNSVNGSFLIGAPSSGGDHSFYLRGTSTLIARVNNIVSGYDILTGLFDIAQATKETELITRLNQTQTSNITWTGSTAGSGSFGNLPLYLGSLGGSSTYFNGHIYQVVIRGSTPTSTELQQTEHWIDVKTG
jgi:hypothetical protein